MDNNNVSDFTDIVRKIESKKILLPDFQREFVWKDEEQQKNVIASVLAKMPIGSILLLRSKPDEYASKIIGCKNEIDTNSLEGEVEFLLDGQQRITVLANVFSSIIHDQCTRISDLISPSLKRRFFLRIPKWIDCYKKEENDIFGVTSLDFKYQNSDAEDPEFLSGDIYPFIECYSFLNNDKKPYNPQVLLSTELDDFCLTNARGYLIPLFLKAPSENSNKSHIILRYDSILRAISEKISNEIEDYFSQISDKTEKEKFIEEIFGNSDTAEIIKNNNEKFQKEIREKAQLWKMFIDNYLTACVKQVTLNKIVVSEKQRDRAIDIYENLNRGGVSLDTFDLIMARVAKVSKENFYKRMIGYIKAEKKYTRDVLPDPMPPIIGSKIDDRTYNASLNTRCYIEEKNEISNKFIDVFLDVLSLYCYNKEFKPENYNVDNIKRKKILALSPEEINDNAERVCNAIDRAMFFLQTRCGIRSIQEVNYALMLVLIASVFMKDEWFEDKTVHGILEAWYWSSLFAGEYDKNQNTVVITHLQSMIKTLKKEQGNEWIQGIKNLIFDAQNFSDEEFILMGKVEEDRYPKAILRQFICQYLLASTYKDMFSDKTISVFSDEAKSLEAHHIIPLGSVAKVGEMTSKLRSDPKNICNSPLNFVYITQEANKEISDAPLDVYIKKITDEAKAELHLSSYTNPNSKESDIKDLLKERYVSLKGKVKSRVGTLLG